MVCGAAKTAGSKVIRSLRPALALAASMASRRLTLPSVSTDSSLVALTTKVLAMATLKEPTGPAGTDCGGTSVSNTSPATTLTVKVPLSASVKPPPGAIV
jgi:hypothetical protein